MEKMFFMIDNLCVGFNEFLKIKKARCGSVEELIQDYPYLKNFPDQIEFFYEVWDDIVPITMEDAFMKTSIDYQRVYFHHLGVVRMMSKLNKKLVNTYKHSDKLGHTYELYEISNPELGIEQAAAVRCWCPSTGNEHWLWVDHRLDFVTGKKSAKDAIAWTCSSPVDVKDIKKIHRQGEVYIFEVQENARRLDAPVHLTGKEYFSLLGNES